MPSSRLISALSAENIWAKSRLIAATTDPICTYPFAHISPMTTAFKEALNKSSMSSKAVPIGMIARKATQLKAIVTMPRSLMQ